MAGTITQTTLSVSISEQISLNGVIYGNNINKTIDGNGKVDQRIMEISSTASDTVFLYQAALPDVAGTGVRNEFTYFRITNTDDAIGVTIEYQFVTATKSSFVYLLPGCSHILMSNDGDVTTTGGTATLENVAQISAKVDAPAEGTAYAYIEYLAVFKGGIVVVEE